jgi:hypothetical protein
MSSSRGKQGLLGEDGLIDWHKALDRLHRATGLVEDKELASYLSLAPSSLSEFRTGVGALPFMAKLRILDAIGFHTLAQALEFLEPEELAAKSRRARERQAKKLAQRQVSK